MITIDLILLLAIVALLETVAIWLLHKECKMLREAIFHLQNQFLNISVTLNDLMKYGKEKMQ